MWTKTQNFEKWAEGYVKQLVAETFRHVESQAAAGASNSAIHFMYSSFLAKFVGAFLFRVLNEKPTINTLKKDRETKLIENVAACKVSIQDSVAAGFQDAMTHFSGQQCDYYCQVKMVPRLPTNSKPC